MPAAIAFELDATKVAKRLSIVAAGLTDFSVPFEKAGNKLLLFYGVEVFDMQGVAGESWRNLSAATMRARARHWGYYKQAPVQTGKALVWTGRLQRGMRKQVDKNALRIYNDVPYFAFHQRAGGRPPQRRMLALTPFVITEVVGEVNKYANELTQKPL